MYMDVYWITIFTQNKIVDQYRKLRLDCIHCDILHDMPTRDLKSQVTYQTVPNWSLYDALWPSFSRCYSQTISTVVEIVIKNDAFFGQFSRCHTIIDFST
jgi:hypothetical protein